MTVHLSSEDMEQVRRCGHVGKLHVAILVLALQLLGRWEDPRIFVAELKIALDPAG